MDENNSNYNSKNKSPKNVMSNKITPNYDIYKFPSSNGSDKINDHEGNNTHGSSFLMQCEPKSNSDSTQYKIVEEWLNSSNFNIRPVTEVCGEGDINTRYIINLNGKENIVPNEEEAVTLHKNNEQNIKERAVIKVEYTNTFTAIQAPDHTNSFPSRTCSDKENENHSYSLRSYVSESESTNIDNDNNDKDFKIDSESEFSSTTTDIDNDNNDKDFKIDSEPEFSSTTTDNSEIIDQVRPILINNNKVRSATPVKLLSEEIKNQRSKTKKVVHCKFCKEDIFTKNFVRHLERNHECETEVINIFQLPKSSKERKIALSALRNDTNFDLYINSNEIRPVRIQSTTYGEPTYYPCAYCKGLFVKSYLRRHSKSCLYQKQWAKGNETRQNHMTNSQTIVACALDPTNVISKLNVKEQVFQIMKSDEIAFEAKKDLLISNFGESYLKKHRRERMVYACSNRMRELSRLLISYRKLTNTSVPFKDLLHPRNFDNVVAAVRIIVGYDHVKKTFKSPSLAMHLGTSLKSACDELTQY
uniref:Uncharacterized protein PF11_0213-like n=1 Tax=Diabrotica virgifera virgifera TaxID=50390 RepID=A0A6P7G1V9_DIAVI